MFLALKNALGKPLVATYKGLLDSFSGASAAYSLRRLSGSYTGHALRVRRSGDNVEADVGFNGGSVSLTSPVTNASGEPAYTLTYSDSAWQFTGSATFTSSSSTGAFVISGTSGTFSTDLTFSTSVASGSAVSVRVTVASGISGTWSVNLQDASGSVVSNSAAITTQGTKTLSLTSTAPATKVVISTISSSAIINASSFSATASEGDTAATTLDAFLKEGAITYSSDYSSGTDSWTFSGGSVAGQASIGGEDNALKVTRSGAGAFFPQRSNVIAVDGTYIITLKLYVPSTNTSGNLNFNVKEAGGGNTVATNLTAQDTWTTFTVELVVSGGNNVIQVTSSSMSDGDEFYIKDFVATQTGGMDLFVDTWYDQSGNEKNATQSTAGNQAKLASGGSLITTGGKIAMDFDGSNDFLDIDFGANLSQPNTVLFVHESDNTNAADNEFFDERGSGQRSLIDVGSDGDDYRIFATGSLFFSGIDITTNQSTVFTVFNGSSSVISINGTAATGTTGTNGINQTQAIAYSEGNNDFYNGTMQEFIVYNSDQSSNRTGLESDLSDFYDI
tara:strand:+ start:221 stop:1900 length:1680 start_codon:yes stop_codon:yes gene_type:complete